MYYYTYVAINFCIVCSYLCEWQVNIRYNQEMKKAHIMENYSFKVFLQEEKKRKKKPQQKRKNISVKLE